MSQKNPEFRSKKKKINHHILLSIFISLFICTFGITFHPETLSSKAASISTVQHRLHADWDDFLRHGPFYIQQANAIDQDWFATVKASLRLIKTQRQSSRPLITLFTQRPDCGCQRVKPTGAALDYLSAPWQFCFSGGRRASSFSCSSCSSSASSQSEITRGGDAVITGRGKTLIFPT